MVGCCVLFEVGCCELVHLAVSLVLNRQITAPSFPGAAVGAGSASAYYSLPDLQATIRGILAAPTRPGPGQDVEVLQRMVRRSARRGATPSCARREACLCVRQACV